MELDKLAQALVKAQGEMKTAKKETANTFFNSKYADLGAVWEACHKALSDNGIAVVQAGCFSGDKFVLRTTLLHTSGQSISGDYLVQPEKQTPQGLGSAWTYSRRYSLAAMVGVISEDDDAEGAMDRTAKPQQAAAKKSDPLSEDTFKRTFVPKAISEKSGKKPFGIKDEAGDWYSTFDDAVADLAKHSKATGEAVTFHWKMNGQYRNLVGAEVAPIEEVAF